ncbi:MAG TPA: hypothetical protein VMI54_01290 [Polyangiaceae bacterium]|nr:hypothetical protein [Polyangiaceae bacterium]
MANTARSLQAFSLRASLFTLALAAAPLACSDGTPAGNVAERGGSIGLSLTANGVTLGNVGYVITGPASFSKSGTIDETRSTTLSANIGAIPAGNGYSITLSATPLSGAASCSGSAPFDVVAGQTTPVSVELLCHQNATTGSVLVNGTVNLCPTLNDVSASPSSVAVGGSVTLSASASDADDGPSPLSYQWTAPGATLTGANTPSATLVCTASGTVTATVSVSDGDPACPETGSVIITCGDGGGSGAGGMNGTGAGGAAATGGAAGTTSAGGMTANGGTTSGGAGASGSGGTSAAGAGGQAAGAGGSGGAGAGGAGAGGASAGAAGSAAGGANAGSSGAGAGGTSAGAGGSSAGGTSSGGAGAGGAGGSGPARDVVVYRIGDGSGSLVSTGNPVFVDEYTATGAFVKSTALPTAQNGANYPLVASGVATSEGFLTLSSDGHFVVLAGYGAPAPISGGAASSTAATVPRVVGLVDAAGNVDTSTALGDWSDKNNPRSAASTNGTDLWLGGAAGGVRYTTRGSTTSVQLNTSGTTVANIRQVGLFGGQLYASDSSGSNFRLSTIGTGLPTTTNQTQTNLPGIATSGTSPYAFFFADLDGNPGVDTLYVADDTNAVGGGVTKYALVGGSWTAEGTAGNFADAYRGLTGVISNGVVTLFAVRKAGNGAGASGELVSLVDASGALGTLTATPTLLTTPGANQVFRGVALAPLP